MSRGLMCVGYASKHGRGTVYRSAGGYSVVVNSKLVHDFSSFAQADKVAAAAAQWPARLELEAARCDARAWGV